jgi:diadenosine tetraphosphatase ApaH/serine/threonine PP2A family protein phosphatase
MLTPLNDAGDATRRAVVSRLRRQRGEGVVEEVMAFTEYNDPDEDVCWGRGACGEPLGEDGSERCGDGAVIRRKERDIYYSAVAKSDYTTASSGQGAIGNSRKALWRFINSG